MENLKNKRIAFLLSGQFRNFSDHLDSLKKLSKNFKYFDFFISTWEDPGSFDKLKISNLFREKNGIYISILNKFISVENFSKYIEISKDNLYLTKSVGLITPDFLNKLSIKVKNFDIGVFREDNHYHLDKLSIPLSLQEAEPIYFRGFLPMLDRNKKGLNMIRSEERKKKIKYDIIFRSQAEVFFKDNFFENIQNLLINYDFIYSPITIDPLYQVSSKLFFGKRDIVISFLNADEEFYRYINKNKDVDFSLFNFKDIPIGERFLKRIKDKYSNYKYFCGNLPIIISRQKFFPNKPTWIKKEKFLSMRFNPLIKYF